MKIIKQEDTVRGGTRSWFLQDEMDFEILTYAPLMNEIKIFKIWIKRA